MDSYLDKKIFGQDLQDLMDFFSRRRRLGFRAFLPARIAQAARDSGRAESPERKIHKIL